MRNDQKGIEIYFELTGGSSYRGFELPRVDCIYIGQISQKALHVPFLLLKGLQFLRGVGGSFQVI